MKTVPKKPTVDVSIRINCGCGFTTASLIEAEIHAANNDHKMTITDMVIPPPYREQAA